MTPGERVHALALSGVPKIFRLWLCRNIAMRRLNGRAQPRPKKNARPKARKVGG
jgi:hypothetical protein